MAISKSEIDKVAYLARLQIDTTETAQLMEKLDRVMNMIDQLKEQETAGIKPLAHPLETTQRLRPDHVTETDNHLQYQAIAPAVESSLYLVPRVVD